MIQKLYKKLIEKHPDDLLKVLVNYSPGIPGKVPPFYSTSVAVNGTLTYTASYRDDLPPAETPEEALEQLYAKIFGN